MSQLFVDANIPMYATGKDHPLREPSQRVMRAIVDRDLDVVADVEVFQEILHRYFNTGQRAEGLRIFDYFHIAMAGRIEPVQLEDLLSARYLAPDYLRLSSRDLVHLAVMRRLGVGEVVSADHDFDGIDGLRRIDPLVF